MTALVLDTGALIALDRNDRSIWAALLAAVEGGEPVYVPAGAIGQAWRDGQRQVLLSRALQHCEEEPLDGSVARAAGLLCSRTRTADVIDASVAIGAAGASLRGDVALLTSDPGDMNLLLSGLNVAVQVIQV